MTNDTITLPTNARELANVVRRHANIAESHYMYRRTMWLLAWYYLQGYRRFDVFDPISGQLSPHLLDKEGNMEYTSQDLLFAINQVAGRISGMDLRLRTETQSASLDGMRSKATSQIIGDATISENMVDKAKDDFGYMFACLGFAGITGHVVDHPTIGLTTDIEVIHPREIYPFPLTGQDHTKSMGLIRQRWITLDKLREIYGARAINSKLDQMEWYEADPGEAWPDRNVNNDIVYWTSTRSIGPSAGADRTGGEKEFIGVAKVRELWLTGVNNTVRRYAVVCGNEVLQDDLLQNQEVYCPIGYARFFNNGTFHGAGMFDMLFSVHRNLEKLTKALFNNIYDLDRYGVLVLPQGQINQNQLLRDVGRGLRTMFWQPDAMTEGFNPFVITPHNLGDMPGRVAQFAREAMQAVNPIQDLIQEKGRVDSASGLAFLDEQIQRTLTTPTGGVSRAWGDMYRSLVQNVTSHLTMSRRALPVGSLTLDLAGAVIDPDALTVSFTDNPLPNLSRINFTVRALVPKSIVARKQEAIDLWAKGINQDPEAFTLFALKENLDFAMWVDEDKAAYEMAVRTILMIYGDGQSPGQAIISPHTTRPSIVLRVLNSFIAGPAMSVASAAVHNAMRKFRLTLIEFMGMVLPSAVPNPDDAAMLSQMQIGAGSLQPGMGPGMMPGLPASPGAPNAQASSPFA